MTTATETTTRTLADIQAEMTAAARADDFDGYARLNTERVAFLKAQAKAEADAKAAADAQALSESAELVGTGQDEVHQGIAASTTLKAVREWHLDGFTASYADGGLTVVPKFSPVPEEVRSAAESEIVAIISNSPAIMAAFEKLPTHTLRAEDGLASVSFEKRGAVKARAPREPGGNTPRGEMPADGTSLVHYDRKMNAIARATISGGKVEVTEGRETGTFDSLTSAAASAAPLTKNGAVASVNGQEWWKTA